MGRGEQANRGEATPEARPSAETATARLGVLVEALRTDEWSPHELVVQLDSTAPSLIAGCPCDRLFADRYERWQALDHRGRPWARLVIGTAGARAEPDDAHRLVGSARSSFHRRHDAQGEGAALCQLGTIADIKGDGARAWSYWDRAREQLGRGSLAVVNRVKLTAAALWRGDLRSAQRFADESAALAESGEIPRTEALAHTWRSVVAAATGHFDVAERSVNRALELWTSIEHARDDESYTMLWLVRGMLHAFRDEHLEGLTQISLGVDLATVQRSPRLEVLALTSRAEFFATNDPAARLRDAERALAVARLLGDERLIAVARRAEAVVERVRGNPARSRELLTECLEIDPSDLARPWLLFRLAETEADLGDREAAAALFEHAARAATRSGADYVEALAAARLTSIADGSATRRTPGPHDEDRAYQALAAAPARVDITLLGMPRVAVDGQPVSFPTRASMLLVIALGLSPEGALHKDELIELLWPERSPEQGARSLRTALWRAKRTLGPAGEYLSRNADAVCLAREHVEIDVVEKRRQAIDVLEGEDGVPLELIGALRSEVAVPWRYEDWVTAERKRNELLAARLEELADRTRTRDL